jgi:hypothetical protein
MQRLSHVRSALFYLVQILLTVILRRVLNENNFEIGLKERGCGKCIYSHFFKYLFLRFV